MEIHWNINRDYLRWWVVGWMINFSIFCILQTFHDETFIFKIQGGREVNLRDI